MAARGVAFQVIHEGCRNGVRRRGQITHQELDSGLNICASLRRLDERREDPLTELGIQKQLTERTHVPGVEALQGDRARCMLQGRYVIGFAIYLRERTECMLDIFAAAPTLRSTWRRPPKPCTSGRDLPGSECSDA